MDEQKLQEFIDRLKNAKPLFTEEERAKCRERELKLGHLIQYPYLQEEAMSSPNAPETKGS